MRDGIASTIGTMLGMLPKTSRSFARPGPAWALVAALAIAAAACATAGSPTGPDGAGEAPAAPEGSAPPPAAGSGSAVPAELLFSAPRLGGGTIEGADYAGQDLALWFWAPW